MYYAYVRIYLIAGYNVHGLYLFAAVVMDSMKIAKEVFF